ncbi:MAG: MBL fold metallo-hydrolase [Actinomycetota bacterium]|jgi:glyoxylase-like metal-dependent hydrolase (beta-lactamase superfamily II)|nr:MAG: MBL fold metallo-hydrolase [Actinomycetota bacterium]
MAPTSFARGKLLEVERTHDAQEAPPARLATTLDAISVSVVDAGTGGIEAFNGVFLLAAREPVLIESASAADADAVRGALDGLGLGPGDLAHIVVTHIHLDHAGGAGVLLERFPRATLWVHEAGARHLVDPERLVASTARTYGHERMRALYGLPRPVPAERVRAVADGARIPLGDRALEVIHAPGHASHHIALLDDASGALFCGEGVGVYLPWAHCIRPALPPPEVDVEAALATIERFRERAPAHLLATHFGPLPPEDGFTRGAERIRRWSRAVRRRLEADPEASVEAIVEDLTRLAAEEYEGDAHEPFDRDRYDAIGSIRMNAEGLARYWRKRWEREGLTR